MSSVPAVAALRDDADVGAALGLQRGRDPGADRRRVPEQRVQPRKLPRRLRVRRGEDLEAAGRVRGDQPAGGRAHRRVEDVARAERLAAALAGAVTRRERVRALGPGLDGPLVRVEQAVADREGSELVELEFLLGHPRLLSAAPPRRRRRRAGCSRRAGPSDGSRRCGAARDSTSSRSRSRNVSRSGSSRSARTSAISVRSERLVIGRPPRPATTS